MDIQKAYQKAYKTYKGLSWVDNPFMGPSAHLSGKFQDLFNAELEQEFKKLYPRRKKYNHTLLPEEIVKPIQEKWQKKALRYFEVKQRQKVLLYHWLQENASSLPLMADWQITYRCEYGKYNSQPNKEGYARGDVKRKAKLLDELNIPYDIRKYGINKEYQIYFAEDMEEGFRFLYRSSWPWNKGFDESKSWMVDRGYVLWAPLTDYQLDAIERVSQKSILELAVECWKNGNNPKVVYPFLPQHIFDESLKIVYGER